MPEPQTDYSAFPATGPDGRARARACTASAALVAEPAATVRYRSGGSLVIIGPGERAYPAAARLADHLPNILVIVAASDRARDTPLPSGVERLRGAVARVSGYLGNFSVSVYGTDGELDLARLFPQQPAQRSIVLDLGDTPFLQQAVLPVGYYGPRGDEVALARALDEIPGLVGDFDKPEFFHYDAAICAHSRSGIQACTRCIDACPTQAIQSIGESIEVNPYLCQGAGSCATACPSGAITYRYPQARDTLDRLRLLLRSYRDSGGKRPVLLIHDREEGGRVLRELAATLPEHLLPFACEETGSLGLETWLAALAYGAAAVVLCASPQTPPPVLRELREQLAYADSLLRGLGYDADRIQLLITGDADAMVTALRAIDRPVIEPPAGFAGFNEKRRILGLALDHLYARSPAPRPVVELPPGAPFGTVTVDGGRCTLCMACVSQCPGQALLAGDDRPQLKFIEENCVQCGLCERSCPEQAIVPSPRYLYEREARNQVRVLHEEEPFLCVRCGKAFATRSTIDRITAKLVNHPMFQGDALRRIQMCEDCRVIAMLESQDTADDTVAPAGRP